MASANPITSEVKPTILDEVDPVVFPRPALVENDRSFSWITEKICGIVEEKTPTWWWVCFVLACATASFTVMGLVYLVSAGTGVWGLANPANWGWAIVNFVFWIGIGHAGTLISAILCLLRQKWRTSINRAAEAMTIFAVVCAGIFPVFHVGRVWMAWFLFPIPNANAIWPNFRSALLWDVFAVSTYGTVSVLFWYVGLIPDLASVRDRAKTRFASFSMVYSPWDGEARTAIGVTTRCATCFSLACPRRSFFLFIRSYLSTSPSPCFQAGIRLFSRLTLLPGLSFPDSEWC